MGKVKRQATKHSNHHDNPNSTRGSVKRRQHSQKRKDAPKKPQSTKNSASSIRQKIPFTKYDNVLLLGEGDFSFTLCLKLHHQFHHVTSTCFDKQDALLSKYPDVGQTLAQISPRTASPFSRTSAELDTQDDGPERGEEAEWEGFSPSSTSLETAEEASQLPSGKAGKIDVLYGIDATKLSSAHKKVLRPSTPFTKIVFNFPHVGGLSTDINRQVRYNQELLVGFFKAAKGLLSSAARPAKVVAVSDEYDSYDENLTGEAADLSTADPGAVAGQILVTLFEGEPYTLWNIRDLARHSGLKVVESFKFPWSAYPGYQHARTIGDIVNGKDRTEEGKRKGAWRGEERLARCYVLEDKDATAAAVGQSSHGRRKKRHDGGNDSE